MNVWLAVAAKPLGAIKK